MDATALLAPIDAARPCGVDLSFAPEADAIAEMRREDDPTLDQGAWVATLKSADWPGVARACEQLLATRSKDLRVAGWLADARARLDGLAGLASGLELCAALLETWWDDLYPRADDGDFDQRIGNLRWLAARVEALAPATVLIPHPDWRLDQTAIAAARTRRRQTEAGRPPPSGDAPALTLETVWREVADGGRAAAATRRAAVGDAQASLRRLEAATDARLGDDAPSFAAARRALDALVDELERLERESGLAPEAEPARAAASIATVAAPVATPETGRAPHAATGELASRAQAVEQLRRVASYFRATEPHSPIAYLADKAVRWADLPLHEWLRQVVKDGGTLAHVEELLGVSDPAR